MGYRCLPHEESNYNNMSVHVKTRFVYFWWKLSYCTLCLIYVKGISCCNDSSHGHFHSFWCSVKAASFYVSIRWLLESQRNEPRRGSVQKWQWGLGDNFPPWKALTKRSCHACHVPSMCITRCTWMARICVQSLEQTVQNLTVAEIKSYWTPPWIWCELKGMGGMWDNHIHYIWIPFKTWKVTP